MRKLFILLLLSGLTCGLLWPTTAGAQATTGTISGTVADTSHAALPGARIVLEPSKLSTVSDSQGTFTLNGVTSGTYNLAVSYVGFSPFATSVTVVAGQVANVNVVLQVASESEQVLVTAPRAHGEAEAINEERTTENILDVLPSKVIVSLPNANIADAVGRLPGVTLERDEGEGKYVQIRGTEPRLSNLTIDGVEVPSPEGTVRQVKLDVIPAGLVQSVQIYKTLQANQPGDAIGGSVNLETKLAGDQPILSFYGSGGFTPIINTVPVTEFGGSAGRRFGPQKRLGVIVSSGFDYNGRGIDDIEPVPGIACDGSATFSSMAVREYKYDRRRFGLGGNVDYKLGSSSSLHLRTLFSDFWDYGRRYEWVINNGAVPSFDTERRTGDFQVASAILGGDHSIGKWTLTWNASVARSRMLTPIGGGESHTIFSFIPSSSNCAFVSSAIKYRPQFSQDCFTEAYNPDNFQLQQIQDSAHGLTAQLNLYGTMSVARTYSLGSHPGVFQFGGSLRNAHKFDNSFEIDFSPITTLLQSMFKTDFTDSNYYDGSYKIGPTTNWDQINQFHAANPGQFILSPSQGIPQGGNTNNFDLVERVPAGYFMNTIVFGRFTLIGGVRFEATQDDTLSFDTTLGVPCLCAHRNGSYVDVLPSAAATIRLDNNSNLRMAYSRGISRPDPAFLTTATNVDNSTTPPTLTIGNPALKPEHAHNFDILYERYLNPIGIVRGGFFYKSLSDPIVLNLTNPCATPPPPGCLQVSQANNAGSAYIAGIELNFVQHFTYFPGPLRGLGLLANYSYSTSHATHVNPRRTTDDPPLLRQAPNAWNISPTYDRGRLSIRVGMAYNGAHIFQYFFTDVDPATGSQSIPAGGLHGPSGDVYLFSHFQVDAQGSYRLGKGWTAVVSALNLNNEPFGFYMGSPQFFIQREYYKPTYSFGFRWDHGER